MKKLCGLVLLFLMYLHGGSTLHAQDSLKTGMKTEASRLLMLKDYTKALPVYRELLRLFPKEPAYQLGVGVCLVNLNREPEEAIRLLRSVSVTDYNPQSWYYLGRAFHSYYSFEDAIKAYAKFMLKGKKSDIRLFQVERLIEMARNGLEYTRKGRPIVVQNLQTIQTDQLQTAAEINGSGRLMRKPLEFCSKTDIRNGYRPWIFLPSYTEINEYIYVAGYEPGKRNQKQLFRIRNINHETWGIPELLSDVINTPYDEDYPYFDVRTSTLYFSSKGHSSMGGYDIFKSVYDWNTRTWSRPENLGFPINSPNDDIVYITDDLNHSASFVSDRNTPPDLATLYRIKLEHDTSGIRFYTVDEIRKASILSVEIPAPGTIQQNIVQSQGEKDLPVPELTASLPGIQTPAAGDYNKILAEALFLQIKADSAARITRDLRVLAKETTDDSAKKQLISNILKNDKEAKSLQREADQKFARARELKGPDRSVTGNDDSILVKSKEINGISVYQYRSDRSKIVKDDTVSTPKDDTASATETQIQDTLARKETSAVLKDDFVLLETSPYNDSNPIPKGLIVYPGLVYRIQLGVFSKAKPNNAFGGISPVCYEQVTGTAVLKYYAGIFYSQNSVSRALEVVRTNGFPDAFILAFLDGKLISTEKAREIEFSGFRIQ